MTYVEFFDKNASENICACLTYVPDRVIYIGNNPKLIKKHIANYKRVFSDRGNNIDFFYKNVSKSNLDNAVDIISQIVETYDDCVFDITGGEEILNLALGVVYAKYPHKNIQIHKFNLRNNTIYDCDKDGVTIYKDTPALSIEENVRIYGGDVAYGNTKVEKTYLWDLTDDFLNDINLIWNICKRNVKDWNKQIGILEAAEAAGGVSGNGLTTVVSMDELERYLVRYKTKYRKIKEIIDYLLKNGLLTCFDDSDRTKLTVTYKNVQVKKCLTRAGQALEMKVYTAAKALLDENGVPVYNDALNGVVIDWDGEFHDKEAECIYDTENEIDVMLMHDVIPVFISCKNGFVSSDELYKLNTVAERFGGQYSKKVLVATALDSLGEAGYYIRQRAKDMNINLIENIQDISDAEFARKLKSLWIN